jgi:NAD(P)-dependent dehydrogenase (short-subunit alcohol dehydrogenase family)
MTASTHTTALITGASRGLGREIARLLVRQGVRLILTARSIEALDDTARELREHGEVLALPGDVADEDHARRLVAQGQKQFGHIDVLVNNASSIVPSPMPPLEEFPLAELQAVYRVNAIAPLHLIQLVLPGMRARGEGVIVNITSDAGVEAYPGWGGYGSSKAALEHLSRVLAAELTGSGIRIYTVDPGDMNTQMHREAEPGEDLSHLPGPEVSAPTIVDLIEHESAPFRRVVALTPVPVGAIGGR